MDDVRPKVRESEIDDDEGEDIQPTEEVYSPMRPGSDHNSDKLIEKAQSRRKSLSKYSTVENPAMGL